MGGLAGWRYRVDGTMEDNADDDADVVVSSSGCPEVLQKS